MILTLCGSLSQNSTNQKLLSKVSQLLPLEQCQAVDLDHLPFFNPDLAGSRLRPPDVLKLDEAVTQAEAIIISTPEYASEIPGALKNALDWMVSTTLLEKKPVLIFSTSASQSGKAQAALKVVLEMVDANVISGPDFHRNQLTDLGYSKNPSADPTSPYKIALPTIAKIKNALQPLGEAIALRRIQALGYSA